MRKRPKPGLKRLKPVDTDSGGDDDDDDDDNMSILSDSDSEIQVPKNNETSKFKGKTNILNKNMLDNFKKC